MSNLSHLKEKDPVRVFESYRNGATPEGGFRGTVLSVARKYLIAEYSNGSHTRTCKVLIETGQSPDQWSHYSVRTVGEAEGDVQRQKSLEILRSVGLRYDGDHRERRISPQLLTALADLVDEYGQEATL